MNFLERIASFNYKEKILIEVNNESLSYEEFGVSVDKLSKRLKYLGIEINDKVGLILPNCILWYEFFWAIVKIGAQPVPLDPQIGYWELQNLINFTEMKACILVPKYRNNEIMGHIKQIKRTSNKLQYTVVINALEISGEDSFLDEKDFRQLPEQAYEVFMPDKNHILLLACTSGSTGNPKILEVPYEGFYEALWDMSQYLGITSDDIMLIGMPLYHQGGFGMGLQTVLQGGHIIYEPQFNPNNFLKIIEEKKPTIIQITTTLAKILISTPDFFERDFSSVKLWYFAGEKLPHELAECFYGRLGTRVVNIIGSSETATMVAWDSLKDCSRDCNIFSELPFTKAKICNEIGEEVLKGEIGELFIATSGLIRGYYKNEMENQRSFYEIKGERYFKTGDMVQQEENGGIRFIGRYKRIIKRGANLVYAEELESFLLTHPDIEAVAITKQEDEILGERILAYIQTRDKRVLTRGDVLKFSRNKLSAYKVPDEVIVVDELPYDIGKIQFKYIRDTKD